MRSLDGTDIALPASDNGTGRDKLMTNMSLAYSMGRVNVLIVYCNDSI